MGGGGAGFHNHMGQVQSSHGAAFKRVASAPSGWDGQGQAQEYAHGYPQQQQQQQGFGNSIVMRQRGGGKWD